MPTRSTKSAPHAPDALDQLRDLVEHDGRSVAAIAAEAGMSRSQLSQVLLGIRRNPSIETVARVLAALGRQWSDLD